MRLRIGIERFDPLKDTEPRIEWFVVEADERSTLLDVLIQIERLDPTIAIPYSCRRGVCGSCAVMVNDVALPACSTSVLKIVKCLGNELVIKPLWLLPRLKDLVVDRSRVLDAIDRYRYWIHRSEPYIPPEKLSKDDALNVMSYRKCSLCLSCLATCPLKQLDRRFGGALAFRMVAERELDPRDSLDRLGMVVNEGLYECMVCDACTAVCPQEIDVGKAVIELRKEAWRRGLAPLKIKDAVESVMDPDYGNPLWMPREERGDWVKGLAPSGEGKVLIFAGCMASYVDKQSVRALAKLLEVAGIKYVVLGEKEYCCGMPLYLAGAHEEARRVAQRNVEEIRSLGVEMIVTPCPSCYRMMKTIYPELGVEFRDIEIVHATQLLYELVNKGVIRIESKLPVVATYHDPCDLGRHEGIYEEPRFLIESVVKEFEEMKRRRDYAQCCGAGGNLRIANPRLSLAVGVERLRKDLPPNAQVLAHACPTCRIQLAEASDELGLSISNESIQELMLKALGIQID